MRTTSIHQTPPQSRNILPRKLNTSRERLLELIVEQIKWQDSLNSQIRFNYPNLHLPDGTLPNATFLFPYSRQWVQSPLEPTSKPRQYMQY